MDSNQHVYRHSLTGKIQVLTEDAASVFPEWLELVADDAKPFEPGLFKPGKVGEFQNPEPLTDSQLAALEEDGESAPKQTKAQQKAAVAAAEAAALEAEAEQASQPERVAEDSLEPEETIDPEGGDQ